MPSLSPIELFVRGVWRLIPDADDQSWVGRAAEASGSNDPLGDLGPLLCRFLDAGVSPSDVARFARIIGYEVAAGLCYYLGDSTWAYEDFDDDQDEVQWGLFEVDPETNEPGRPILGAHELLLMSDPTGQEMRPRPH